MTFRYSKTWIYFDLAAALAMGAALYVGLHPKLWGWLLFAPLFLFMVYETVRKYRYSVTVDQDHISVASFKPSQYRISEIAEVSVSITKRGRMGVVSFADRGNLSLSGRLAGFDDLIRLLRAKANLRDSVRES